MLKDDFTPLDILHQSPIVIYHTCPQLRKAVNYAIGHENCPACATAHRIAVLLIHNNKTEWPKGWGCYEFACRNIMTGALCFDYQKPVSVIKAYRNPELLCKVKHVPGIHEDHDNWEFKWL